MVIQRIKQRLVRRRNVQQLIFMALGESDWMSERELKDRLATLNDDARIPSQVRDVALSQLYRRAFVEIRRREESLSAVIEVRARSDAHRQWRCASPMALRSTTLAISTWY